MSLDNPTTTLDKNDLEKHHKDLRDEANQPIDEVPVGEPTKKNADNSDLRQRRHRQKFYSRKSESYDGGTRKKSSSHRV